MIRSIRVLILAVPIELYILSSLLGSIMTAMKSEFDIEQWNRINEVDRINQEKLLTTGWWHSIDLGGGVVTPGARTLE